MKLSVLDKTPGLLFTLLLIAFVIGTMVNSLWTIRKAREQPPPTQPAPPAATQPAPPAATQPAPPAATPHVPDDDDDD